MEKTETLKDGKKVIIRPLTSKDLDKLMAFYKTLPPEDRKYLRVDVTDRKIVAERIPRTDQGPVFRIISLNPEPRSRA